LPKELSDVFISLWVVETEQKTKEAQVSKVADKLSLISKCYEEMKVGNEFFQPIYERELEKLYTLEHPWWQQMKEEVLGKK
ncbi:MAG: hypothetical protein G01um101470_534, partial [Parcubacteria group bacterium Gr01-1014_70]